MYALSNVARNNLQEDVLSLSSVNIDYCLTQYESELLHEMPLQKPLTNIFSSVEDLKLANVKINEIQELIDKKQTKKFEHFKMLRTTWGSVLLLSYSL